MTTNRVLIVWAAKVAHEANRTWCELHRDRSQKPWDEASEWQQQSAIRGVEFADANPDAGDSAQHDAWMADKIKEGWTYGELKDADARTHPCLVPFDQLPEFQQVKDRIFRAIVGAVLYL